MSHHALLLVILIVYILCLAFGIARLEQAYGRQILCIVFVVQGASGLFAVVAYRSVIVSLGPAFLLKQFSLDKRCIKRYPVTLPHLIVAFCIIWFFTAHILFLPQLLSDLSSNRPDLIELDFTVVMVIVQFIVGIWLLCGMHHNRRLMERNRETTQRRPNPLAQCHMSVEKIKFNESLSEEDLLRLDYNQGGRLAQNDLRQV